MFIELTDHLRCPADHEEQFLVLLPDRMEGRSVLSGELGCPVCGRVVRVEEGVADFGAGTRLRRRGGLDRRRDSGGAPRTPRGGRKRVAAAGGRRDPGPRGRGLGRAEAGRAALTYPLPVEDPDRLAIVSDSQLSVAGSP